MISQLTSRMVVRRWRGCVGLLPAEHSGCRTDVKCIPRSYLILRGGQNCLTCLRSRLRYTAGCVVCVCGRRSGDVSRGPPQSHGHCLQPSIWGRWRIPCSVGQERSQLLLYVNQGSMSRGGLTGLCSVQVQPYHDGQIIDSRLVAASYQPSGQPGGRCRPTTDKATADVCRLCSFEM